MSATVGGDAKDHNDKADLLVEVSTGGQLMTRRWARSPNGGFERLPPTRQSKEDVAPAAAAAAEADGVCSWDVRQSPRLRAIFLPAG